MFSRPRPLLTLSLWPETLSLPPCSAYVTWTVSRFPPPEAPAVRVIPQVPHHDSALCSQRVSVSAGVISAMFAVVNAQHLAQWLAQDRCPVIIF